MKRKRKNEKEKELRSRARIIPDSQLAVFPLVSSAALFLFRINTRKPFDLSKDHKLISNNSVCTDFMLLCINRSTDIKSPLKFQRFVQRDTNSRARTRRVSTSRACLEYTEYILTRALRSGSALALCAFGHFRLRSAVFVLRSRTNHNVRPTANETRALARLQITLQGRCTAIHIY